MTNEHRARLLDVLDDADSKLKTIEKREEPMLSEFHINQLAKTVRDLYHALKIVAEQEK